MKVRGMGNSINWSLRKIVKLLDKKSVEQQKNNKDLLESDFSEESSGRKSRVFLSSTGALSYEISCRRPWGGSLKLH